MANSIVKFFDIATRPPRGGWHFPIGGERIEKYNESDLISEIAKWQRNNGKFVSMEDIEEKLWAYFCSREPTRCYLPQDIPPAPLDGPAVRREVTKELQGPPIWTFLNTLAVQWTPAMHDYFLATCDAILSILECPDCRNEWRRTLAAFPPTVITSKLSACQWVNTVHNAVNSRSGKGYYPYERMVLEWGAPLS